MKVRLALHARNLRSVHKFRPSSPYATVSTYTGDVREAFVLGKTEAIQFTSDPMWVKPILIDYEYGTTMQVKVSIFDQSSSSSKSGDKPIGSAVVLDIDAVLRNNVEEKRSVGGLVANNLPGGDGWIFLQANIVPGGEELKQLALTIEGRDISTGQSGPSVSIVKPDTFFEICRKNIETNGRSWARPVYRSEVAKSSSKPKWGKARISLDWLCNGDIHGDVQISIFEHRRTGQPNQIAMCVLSVDSLVRFNRLGLTWEGKDAGKIKIIEARIINDPCEDTTYARSSSYRSTTSAKTTSSSYSQSTYETTGTVKTMNVRNQPSSGISKGKAREKRSSEPSSVVPGTFTVVSLNDDDEPSSPSSRKKGIEVAKRKARSKSLDAMAPSRMAASPSSNKATCSSRHKVRRKPRSSSFDQAHHVENSLRVSPTDTRTKQVKKRLSFDTAIHYSPHPSQDDEEDDWGEEEAILAAVKAIQSPDQVTRSRSEGSNNRATSIGSNASSKSAATSPKLSRMRRRTVSIGASSASSAQPSRTAAGACIQQKTGRRKSLDAASSLAKGTSPKSTQSDRHRSSVKGTGRPIPVELLFHARNLRNRSKLTGVSDPYATVMLIDPSKGGGIRVLGTTEVVDNCLSPVWCEPIVFEYVPNSFASIEVKIFDKNDNQEDKEMGVARFDVSSILSSKTCMKAKRLEKGGWVFVNAEALSQDTPQKDVTVTLEGRDLKNVEGMMKGVSDPFFVFSTRDGNGEWREIYRSEHIPNNLNPTWNQASINYRRLCGNSDTVPFRINVYDHEKSGKHRDMGSLETTVEGLISAYGFDSHSKPLVLKKNGENFGLILVKRAYVSTAPSRSETASSTARRGRHFQPKKQEVAQHAAPSEEQWTSNPQPKVPSPSRVEVPSMNCPNQDFTRSVPPSGSKEKDTQPTHDDDITSPADSFAPVGQRRREAVLQQENGITSESTTDPGNESRGDARSGFMAIFRALQLSEEKLSADSSRVLRSKDAMDTIGSTFRNIGGLG